MPLLKKKQGVNYSENAWKQIKLLAKSLDPNAKKYKFGYEGTSKGKVGYFNILPGGLESNTGVSVSWKDATKITPTALKKYIKKSLDSGDEVAVSSAEMKAYCYRGNKITASSKEEAIKIAAISSKDKEDIEKINSYLISKGFRTYFYDGDIDICTKFPNFLCTVRSYKQNIFVFLRYIECKGRYPAFEKYKTKNMEDILDLIKYGKEKIKLAEKEKLSVWEPFRNKDEQFKELRKRMIPKSCKQFRFVR